jgi:lipoate---protein ligase
LIELALHSDRTDPYRNLALEEALLGDCKEELLERKGGGLLLLYANSPCVVVGRNQNPWAEAAEGSGIPTLRRVSGGGAVYHDEGNLNWALVVPRHSHNRSSELALVARALGELGIDAAEGERGGLYLAGEGPFAGAKISGTARRIGAERVLHHGTLLVDSDLALMKRSLGGLELERSRALASVSSPCANLASVLPGLGVGDVAEALARSIAGAAPEAAEGYADQGIAAEAETRLRGWAWTWGATPAFSVVLTMSGGTVRVEVLHGRVAAVSGPGAEACTGFVGLPFDYGTPQACAEAIEANDISR